MLDIKFVRENVEKVMQAVRDKNASVDVPKLLEFDKERLELLRDLEQLNSLKNDLNDLVRQSSDSGERADIIAKGKEIKEKLEIRNREYAVVKEQFDTLLKKLPNMPSDDTPVGKDDSENVVVREVGERPTFEFQPKEHWELGALLDVLDIVRAGKVSGSRFAYLKGDLALLQFALIQYALGVLTDRNTLGEIATTTGLDVPYDPFVPVIPPVFIKPEPFERMARLEPRDERYHIQQDDLYLIGSAEHTLGAMHMDETIDEKDLPLRYAGYSTAFRREAGSYGKDTKGILRVHQFDKLEMESFTVAERSQWEQDFFVGIQEYLVSQLGLPYRVVMCCTGDMGDPDARHLDIETWMPGQDRYRETHSADLMTDYQSRRLNTRVRRADGSLEFVHMNDATAIAIGRTIIAIMENYQQKDGSILIPEVLRKYMGKNSIEKR